MDACFTSAKYARNQCIVLLLTTSVPVLLYIGQYCAYPYVVVVALLSCSTHAIRRRFAEGLRQIANLHVEMLYMFRRLESTTNCICGVWLYVHACHSFCVSFYELVLILTARRSLNALFGMRCVESVILYLEWHCIHTII